MRLSVRVPAQNALFRRVRLSSPGQTWRRLTEKRTLRVKPHGEAHSVPAAHQKAHSARERPPRLRLYVRRRGQTALFRRVRFSSPAQTWRRLTERRTLCPDPHGKAHFGKDERRRARRRCARRRRARRHEQLTAEPEATSLPNLSAYTKVTRSAQPCTRPRLSARDPSAQALRGCA